MSKPLIQERPLKRGDRVERTALARGVLRVMGMNSEATRRGVYTGKARGKHAGCDLVRVDGAPKAEPFETGYWQRVR